MNILVLGTGIIEQKFIEISLKSKLLDHIYTASNTPLENIPNIEYLNFEDLISKAKTLQIDLVLLANKEFIQEGIVELFKKNFINVISVNQKWLNLETSRLAAKQLINYYAINTPEIIKAPVTFPTVIKTNIPHTTKIANSMQELINYTEQLAQKTTYLEEYLDGETIYMSTLWDGKNVIFFDKNHNFTEIQKEKLDLYKTKLNFMLSDENADFIGFFTNKLIWAKNDWYVLDFIMRIDEHFNLENVNCDFLYLLNSAIYQKLNEINL